MAVGDEPLRRSRRQAPVVAGTIALSIVALIVAGAFAGLASQLSVSSNPLGAFDAYLLRTVRFTLWQALLSTALAVVLALPVAHALHRQAFAGRRLLLQLFAVPLGVPAIVAALGIVTLYGRAGYLAQLAPTTWPNIYGLGGILLAHVFFNLPLAARLLLEALEAIPADQRRLAAQLGMGARASFRYLEWPVLRSALPGVAGLVFMLCVTSFTIVLTLGGGPRATTLEVAIYQALRFDFDPGRAALLTLVQILLTVAVVAILMRLRTDFAPEAGLSVSHRMMPVRGGEAFFNGAVIVAALVFVAAPLAAIAAAGLTSDLARLVSEPSVLGATATSLGLSALAALAGVMLSFAFVSARRRMEIARRGAPASILERLFDSGAATVLVVPPVLLGAGWFIVLMRTGAVFSFAPVMVVAVNALMAMPFVMRVIRPAHDGASARHERLCASLGISGLDRLRLVDWPALRRPAATAFAFAMALSLGDLGVIALFGSDQVQTLPYLLLSRMSSYRTQDAAGLALLLGLLCLSLMVAADRLGWRKR